MSNAFDDMICPDCGGKIGGGDGHRPCSCNTEKKRRRPAPAISTSDGQPHSSSGSSASVGSNTSGPAPHLHGAPTQKLCRVCGKDLTNRSRLRDDYGYICKPCADKEDKGEIAKPTGPKPVRKGSMEDLLSESRQSRCQECNKKIKAISLVPYRGKLICKSCAVYHEEHDGLKVGKVSLEGHDKHDREQVKKLAMIAAVVLLIALGNLVYYVFIK